MRYIPTIIFYAIYWAVCYYMYLHSCYSNTILLFNNLGIYECCARSRYQVQGNLITSTGTVGYNYLSLPLILDSAQHSSFIIPIGTSLNIALFYRWSQQDLRSSKWQRGPLKHKSYWCSCRLRISGFCSNIGHRLLLLEKRYLMASKCYLWMIYRLHSTIVKVLIMDYDSSLWLKYNW